MTDRVLITLYDGLLPDAPGCQDLVSSVPASIDPSRIKGNLLETASVLSMQYFLKTTAGQVLIPQPGFPETAGTQELRVNSPDSGAPICKLPAREA